MVCNFIYSLYENKIVNFSFSYLLTLGLFLAFQPKEGENPKVGFNTLIFSEHKCYHMHHWIYMISSSIIITSVVFLSKGNFTPPIVTSLGCLTGGSFSDLIYSDAFNFDHCNFTKYNSVV